MALPTDERPGTTTGPGPSEERLTRVTAMFVWPIMAAVVFLTFLCTRGPILGPWAGFGAIAVVLGLWTSSQGFGWVSRKECF